MLVIHLYVNTCDAMGANIINTMVESIAPNVEVLTKGKVYLRILSNYANRSLAKATCTIPQELLATEGFSGEEVRDGVIHAYEFAARSEERRVGKESTSSTSGTSDARVGRVASSVLKMETV